MFSRNALMGAAVAVTMLASGCGGRSTSTTDGGTKTDAGTKVDAGTGGGSGGGTGGGSGGGTGGGTGGGMGGGTGGGTGGGSGGCQGGPDAGTVTTMIGNLRSSICYGTRVKVEGAVVIAEGGELAAKIDGGTVYSFDFWVADPANPENAIYVSKFKDDLVVDDQGAPAAGWVAKPGDKVDLEGVFSVYYNDADRRGNRPGISDGYQMVKGNGGAGQLKVTLRGTTTPPADAQAPSGFGNGLKANPEFAGRRVRIPGPLEITSAAPTALNRFKDGGVTGSNGFEVTGGVLVNNYYTYRAYDGGSNVTNCNWMAEAAGGKTVTFPNGISGVWDTYTHSPAQGAVGFVPGTNDAGYTYVLYPVDCATDLAGSAQ